MNRRNFLKNMSLAAIPTMIDGFPVNALAPNTWLSALTAAAVETDHVLVLVQLNGGNDGLNTVIPLDTQYAAYTAARPNIYIKEPKVLKLNGVTKLGLNPGMTAFQRIFNEGMLKIVMGVGYPQQNFSHFRSTDVWLTASDSIQVLSDGWMGRYLNYEYPNYPVEYPNTVMPDPLAIQIGSIASVGFQFQGINPAFTITNPDAFYNLINNVHDPAPDTKAGNELSFIREVASQTKSYANVVKAASAKVKTQSPNYPANNSLANQLKIVARLVAGGLKTRVYMVNMGGFDTHVNQVNGTDSSIGTHTNLLTNLSAAIAAFLDDCKFLGVDHRVAGMTFSEFGRRIKSNNSGGTDHGAASPMFVFGKPVVGGVLGENPIIPTNITVNDNVPMQYDFRSIYATFLQDWFCVPKPDVQNVMLQNFQSLSLLSSTCRTTATHELNAEAGKELISNYPNPYTDTTTIKFETTGEHVLIQIFDNEGRLVRILADGIFPEGKHEIWWNSENTPTGIYYCRLQNGALQQVKVMIKVR